ncbi:NlpC/P60 family cell wall peptidase [Ruegeria phage RpAliso]|nr:NlpC/P60 family cell wall peptidase [Ruegeria phage RpAliso]
MIIKATNEEIVAYARRWKGAAWRHQGRGNGGIDCVGLLVRTMLNFDIPHEDVRGYRREPGPQFIESLHACTQPNRFDGPVHGAIAVFSDSIMPCHTGIFAVENGRVTVIHSEAHPKRMCHEEGFDDSIPSLKDRLVDIRLFNNVDYGG